MPTQEFQSHRPPSYQHHSVGRLTLHASSPPSPHPRGGRGWLLRPRPLYTDPKQLLLSCPSKTQLTIPTDPCSEHPSSQDQGGSILSPPLVSHHPSSFPNLPAPRPTHGGLQGSPQSPTAPGLAGRGSKAQGVLLDRTASLASRTRGPRAINAELYRPSAPFRGLKCYGCLGVSKPTGVSSWLPAPISQAHSQPESPAPFLTTPMAFLFKRQKEKIKNFRTG